MDLNIKAKTRSLQKKKDVCHFVLGKNLLDKTQRIQTIKEKINCISSKL